MSSSRGRMPNALTTAPRQRFSARRVVLVSTTLALVIFSAATTDPRRPSVRPITPDEFVQALATRRPSVIDMYLKQNLDPNARAAHDRPLIVAAVLEQDWDIVARLLKVGACPDLADEDGVNALMAAARHSNVDILRQLVGTVTNVNATDRSGRTALHHAIASGQVAAVQLLLSVMGDLEMHGSSLLADALDGGNPRIIDAILESIPPAQEWSAAARRLLEESIIAGNHDHVRLLLKKHAAPPAVEGSNVPLLAHAIVRDQKWVVRTLLACGADPNTALPPNCDKDFLALIESKYLRNHIAADRDMNVLMLAAGLGEPELVQALLQAGADRKHRSTRYEMLPLHLAARNGSWRCTQLLLGGGPAPEQLRLEILLASQTVALIKDGIPVFNTSCSTGSGGKFATPAGDYIITDKDRHHVSTIYKVEMPYFMRFNCLDFGMHEGYVPNYPASHGCIRLPSDAARKFFDELPIGTLVSVK